MELNHAIRGRFAYTVATDPDGRERLVVVGKQTYRFDLARPGEVELRLEPDDKQLPLVEVDRFTGTPGASAPLCEADFASFKPHCDLLFVGSAHAPGGQPTRSCEVALQLGPVDKRLRVTGPRQWSVTLGSVRLTPARTFERVPVSYDLAFGGPGHGHNPAGLGFGQRGTQLDGRSGPSLEALDDPIRSPNARHRPVALGGIGRAWLPRRHLAGTYDEAWREQHAPFLPPDFDYAFHQSAPFDQQLPYPSGGELLTMHNLTPAGVTRLRLPAQPMPVEFGRRDGSRSEAEARLDTIWIDGLAGVVTLCWRSSLALRRDVSEIAEVLFGPMSPGFSRARAMNKTFYRSLAELPR